MIYELEEPQSFLIPTQGQLRIGYGSKGREAVIVERRLRWDNPEEWTNSPVAKLKCIRSANKWRLCWQWTDLKWHEDPGPLSSDCISDLAQEVATDPLACFFG